ncbi:MAG: ZIP family metal transporter [Bacilli bacterium]|nr:ZIP family metal transporter [Bacilli bacterium]
MIKLFPLLLTTISGISTLIGYLLIFLKEKYEEKIIVFSLSFASGILLTISIIQLIPESFHLLNNIKLFPKIILQLIFFNLGIILIKIIHKIDSIKKKGSLYQLGILSMLAIILHNIPEGMITYLTTKNNISIGIKLTLAIALHNIPEGITIAVPIYYSTKSKKKAFLYTLISSLSEPLGAILTALFLEKYITKIILSGILMITAAIMIELSKEEFKESKNYNNKNLFKISFLLGTIIMILTSFI